MNSITVERKRLPDVIQLLISLGVGCVAFSLQVKGYDWIGGFLFTLAVWGCMHAAFKIQHGDPRLVINLVGIFCSSWGQNFMEWSEFEDAVIRSGDRGADFLCLAHRDPDKLARRVKGFKGLLHIARTRRSGVADLWINATELKLDPKDLLRIAREGIRRTRAP